MTTVGWWPADLGGAFWANVLPAILTGVFAGLAAYLAVQWTARRAAAAAKTDRSYKAAEEIQRRLAILAPQLPTLDDGAIFALQAEWRVQQHVISDAELARRVEELIDDLNDYDMGRRIGVMRDDYFFMQVYQLQLYARYDWVNESLGAHRRAERLPAIHDGVGREHLETMTRRNIPDPDAVATMLEGGRHRFLRERYPRWQVWLSDRLGRRHAAGVPDEGAE